MRQAENKVAKRVQVSNAFGQFVKQVRRTLRSLERVLAQHFASNAHPTYLPIPRPLPSAARRRSTLGGRQRVGDVALSLQAICSPSMGRAAGATLSRTFVPGAQADTDTYLEYCCSSGFGGPLVY
eukprot:3356748-Pleurochrysis_carterae.AAC.2